MELRIQNLIGDERYHEAVRKLRWAARIKCVYCESKHVIKRGWDDKEPNRQRYECQGCDKRFDNLTHTVFAGWNSLNSFTTLENEERLS
jgi:transposase-like protein